MSKPYIADQTRRNWHQSVHKIYAYPLSKQAVILHNQIWAKNIS